MNIDQLKNNQPALNVFDYFQGKTRGWGMVQDRKGKPIKQFTVDINGFLNDQGHLILEEDFIWSDGKKTQRVWTLKQTAANQYSGFADDVVGEAKGIAAGNALNLKYEMILPVGDKTYNINFDDWMYLQPDGVVINRAKMSKFGFSVGEVILSFNKI